MPITSVGYEGSVNEEEWAELLAMAGGRQYGVLEPGSWRATVGVADREVRLSAGAGFGWGVVDRSTEDASIVLPPTQSGSVWHLIAMRRDWQANVSAFGSIAGGSAQALPARETTPGTSDDQPLWLARVDAGRSQVQQLLDLRVWGSDGGAFAMHPLVLQFLNRLGTVVQVGDSQWHRVLDSMGAPAWTEVPIRSDRWIAIPVSAGRRNGGGVYPLGYQRTAGGIILRGAPIMTSGTFTIGALLAQLPAGIRPTAVVRPPIVTGSSGTARLAVGTDGAIRIDRVESGAISTWYSLDGLFIPL